MSDNGPRECASGPSTRRMSGQTGSPGRGLAIVGRSSLAQLISPAVPQWKRHHTSFRATLIVAGGRCVQRLIDLLAMLTGLPRSLGGRVARFPKKGVGKSSPVLGLTSLGSSRRYASVTRADGCVIYLLYKDTRSQAPGSSPNQLTESQVNKYLTELGKTFSCLQHVGYFP